MSQQTAGLLFASTVAADDVPLAVTFPRLSLLTALQITLISIVMVQLQHEISPGQKTIMLLVSWGLDTPQSMPDQLLSKGFAFQDWREVMQLLIVDMMANAS